MKFTVHLVETRFYDVPVDAANEDEAFNAATEIVDETHLDHKSGSMDLADWTATPIETVVA